VNLASLKPRARSMSLNISVSGILMVVTSCINLQFNDKGEIKTKYRKLIHD
jgi:hypothetical protein